MDAPIWLRLPRAIGRIICGRRRCAVAGKWGVAHGVDAAIDLGCCRRPPGCLLRRRCWWRSPWRCSRPTACARSFEELMEVLPDGEQFVGTRGGGMDHAASLASRAGCASLVEFAPLAVRHIPMPADWGFLVAHSLQTAEKSGAAREAIQRAARGRGHGAGAAGAASRTVRRLPSLRRHVAGGLDCRTERDSLPAHHQRSAARARGGGGHGARRRRRASARCCWNRTPACATGCA